MKNNLIIFFSFWNLINNHAKYLMKSSKAYIHIYAHFGFKSNLNLALNVMTNYYFSNEMLFKPRSFVVKFITEKIRKTNIWMCTKPNKSLIGFWIYWLTRKLTSVNKETKHVCRFFCFIYTCLVVITSFNFWDVK